MDYFEVKIYTSTKGIEAVSSLLAMMGYLTFVIEDKSVIEEFLDKKNEYEWDYVSQDILEKQYDESNITLYMEADKASADYIAEIASAVKELKFKDSEGIYGRLAVESRLASDKEWKDKWKEYFKPAKISDSIVVCPSWEKYETVFGEKIISIDPGMAFGTGTHATTRMCVQLLEKYTVSDDELILDLGCGSGILSIAAALCGAQHIRGIDIDNNAVETSIENVQKNGFDDIIDIAFGDVTEGLGFQADIIVANLMAELIIGLTSDIVNHLRGRGIFIGSGIITEKKNIVIKALDANGLIITDVLEADGWCAIAAHI